MTFSDHVKKKRFGDKFTHKLNLYIKKNIMNIYIFLYIQFFKGINKKRRERELSIFDIREIINIQKQMTNRKRKNLYVKLIKYNLSKTNISEITVCLNSTTL